MGNTENETRSELLQKIEALRLQLDALEKEVKETLQDAGPLPADPEAQEETPAVSAALPEPQVEAKEPAEDLPQEPIDISISDARSTFGLRFEIREDGTEKPLSNPRKR